MTDQPSGLSPDALPARGKRAYVKPTFQCERVFETMALACGKILGQAQEQCRRLASNS